MLFQKILRAGLFYFGKIIDCDKFFNFGIGDFVDGLNFFGLNIVKGLSVQFY